ncbi:VOC family protein [Brachybacterium sp. YJGR34]|uniref:VOC family protein n=1 Tax=Brachybacterium sp. YJGR34 TaxID=2059911 RepID=UPI000E0B7862|nr:VOC family protein [Brachybacterium sp. YJGR34]
MTRPDWMTLFLDTPIARWRAAVRFWAAITGTAVSPSRGENGQFVTLRPPHGDAWLKLQAIDAPAPRMHLDLDAADRPGAIAASRNLGATRAWTYHDVAVMRSPGGVLFCHTLGEEGHRPRMQRDGLALVADQVRLAVPARFWEVELEFWRGVTGLPMTLGARGESAVLRDDDPTGPPRILLQRRLGDAPRVRANLDVLVRDLRSEIQRHERLGARRLADDGRRIRLMAPSGHVYRLTAGDPSSALVADSL